MKIIKNIDKTKNHLFKSKKKKTEKLMKSIHVSSITISLIMCKTNTLIQHVFSVSGIFSTINENYSKYNGGKRGDTLKY